MRKRGISVPKPREPRPCHACYRDRGANPAYCDACTQSGAAAFHQRMRGSTGPPRRFAPPDPPATVAKPARTRKPRRKKRAPSEDATRRCVERDAARARAAEARVRAVESAAAAARERAETCEQRSAERQARIDQREADRLAARQEREEARMRRAVEREHERAAKRRRQEAERIAGQTKRGSSADPRRTGNRTRAGEAVTRQRPARAAALALMEGPGRSRVLHTYRAPQNVKAAIWYLRHHVELPDGVWTFWRDGCDLVGMYEPIHPGVPVSSR